MGGVPHTYSTHLHTYMHILTYTQKHANTRARTHRLLVGIAVHTHTTLKNAYKHARTHTLTYMRTHTHTHTRTHACARPGGRAVWRQVHGAAGGGPPGQRGERGGGAGQGQQDGRAQRGRNAQHAAHCVPAGALGAGSAAAGAAGWGGVRWHGEVQEAWWGVRGWVEGAGGGGVGVGVGVALDVAQGVPAVPVVWVGRGCVCRSQPPPSAAPPPPPQLPAKCLPSHSCCPASRLQHALGASPPHAHNRIRTRALQTTGLGKAAALVLMLLFLGSCGQLALAANVTKLPKETLDWCVAGQATCVGSASMRGAGGSNAAGPLRGGGLCGPAAGAWVASLRPTWARGRGCDPEHCALGQGEGVPQRMPSCWPWCRHS